MTPVLRGELFGACVLILAALHCGNGLQEVESRALTVPTPPERAWPSPAATSDLPAWRFVDGGAPSRGVRGPVLGAVTVTQVTPGEVRVEGPIAWMETTVTIVGRKGGRSSGELEVALPASTFAAAFASSADGVSEPMREMGERTREATRAFRTGTLSIAEGETKQLVVRHALVLGENEADALFPLDDGAPRTKASGQTSSSAGHLAIRTDAPAPASSAASLARASGAIVLCDTSAARARDLGRQLSLVREAAAALGDARLVVAAYDEAVATLYDGPANRMTSAVGEALLVRQPLGGSNSPAALRFALDLPGDDLQHVIFVTDGIDARPFGTVALANAKSRSLTLAVPTGNADLGELERLVGSVALDFQAISLEEEPASIMRASLDPMRRGSAETPTIWPFRSRGTAVARGRVLVAEAEPTAESSLPAFVVAASKQREPSTGTSTSLAEIASKARPLPTAEEVRTIVDPMAGLDPSNHTAKAVPLSTPSVPAKPSTETPPKEELPTIETEGDEGPSQIPPETIQWIVRKNFGRFRGCYRDALRRSAKVSGRVVVRFDIDSMGAVPLARAVKADVGDTELVACVVRSFEALSFPALPNASAVVEYPLVLAAKDGAAEAVPLPSQRPNKLTPELDPNSVALEPWQGTVKDIHDASDRGDHATALSSARELALADATSPDGFILLGDAFRRSGDEQRALRAYTSVLESHPELRVHVALRLLSLTIPAAKKLATELAALAAAGPEPDPEALRILAFVAASSGDVDAAAKAIDVALLRPIDPARFPGLRDLLRADLGMLTAAVMTKRPADRVQLKAWAAGVGVVPSEKPATTVSATWEGSKDMDLAVRDIGFNAANKGTPVMPSGGKILADVAQGRGPEAFVVETPASHPYWIGMKAKLDRSFGFGSVMVIEHDGQSRFRVTVHPFDLNVDGGSADVLKLEGPFP